MSQSTIAINKELLNKISVVCILSGKKRSVFIKESLEKAIEPYLKNVKELKLN